MGWLSAVSDAVQKVTPKVEELVKKIVPKKETRKAIESGFKGSTTGALLGQKEGLRNAQEDLGKAKNFAVREAHNLVKEGVSDLGDILGVSPKMLIIGAVVVGGIVILK